VPRTTQSSVLDAPLAERAALVRASVVERTEPLADPTQRDRAPIDGDRFDAAVVESNSVGNPEPCRSGHCITTLGHCITPASATPVSARDVAIDRHQIVVVELGDVGRGRTLEPAR
jgi:hypothetical protein